jgi:hypothetical protein
VLERYNLINRIITPTRITKTSSSLIDVIITEAFNGDIKIVNKERVLRPYGPNPSFRIKRTFKDDNS